RARKRQDFIAPPGAMRRVHDDWQVAAALDGGDDAQVQRISRVVGEGAHAALAEDHVVVSFGHNVFRGHQKFVQRGGHAPLQQHRLSGAAGALQQRKILHVARADLDYVRVLFDQVERFVVNRLGDDAEAETLAHLGENLQTVFAEALKTVRRGSRLIGAAAEEMRARGADALGDRKCLLAAFDGAWAADNHHSLAAKDDITGRGGDAHLGVFLFYVAAHELIGLADGDAFDDARHAFEGADVHRTRIAGD